MKKQEALAKIEELKAFIEAIDAKPKTVWDLEEDDEYYVASYYGVVNCNIWDDDKVDIKNRSLGSVFLTEQEAKDEVRRREIYTKLKRLAGGYEWKVGVENYYIATHYPRILVNCSDLFKHIGQVYFETNEAAQAAIDEIGEDDLKFLMGVR